MHNDLIIQTVKELLRAMGLVFEEVGAVESSDPLHPRFIVKSADSALLIGTKGEHLSSFNSIARRIVSKKLPAGTEPVKFFVDVNGYFENAVKDIEIKAKVMAERARSFKTSVELDPMSPYERMIVHAALQAMPNIKTESTGFGKTRRVVIKYTETENTKRIPEF